MFANRNFIFKNVKNISRAASGQIQRRRVVVTGVGVISPVGCRTEIAWKNILNGVCGIKKLTDPVYTSLPCKIAAKIGENDLNLNEKYSKSELRSLAPATAYALLAGKFNFHIKTFQILTAVFILQQLKQSKCLNGNQIMKKIVNEPALPLAWAWLI